MLDRRPLACNYVVSGFVCANVERGCGRTSDSLQFTARQNQVAIRQLDPYSEAAMTEEWSSLSEKRFSFRCSVVNGYVLCHVDRGGDRDN